MATLPQLRPRVERGASAFSIAHVAEHMRQADRDEIKAAYGHDPFHALMASTSLSDMLWTGFNKNEPICIFGVGTQSFMEGTGSPWMLGTDGILACKYAFVYKSALFVDSMLARYRKLSNYVDARNHVSIRWLCWLGFKIEEPVPYGLEQLPFHKFGMIRHV